MGQVKRREVKIGVTDHAVLRWLEREYEVDIDAVRRLIAGHVLLAAQTEAVSVQVSRVRYVLRDALPDGGVPVVAVVTALRKDQRRGVGSDNGRRVKRHD